MIYPNASDGALVFTLVAPTVFFSAMSQTIYGSLQGMGKIMVPAISVLFGGIVKVILNLILIPVPYINIYGAAMSSIACQATAFAIGYLVLRKNLSMKLPKGKFFVKPFAASVIMGGVTMFTHHFLCGVLGNTFATLAAISVAVVAYFTLIGIFGIFSREELSSLPFIGKKFKK